MVSLRTGRTSIVRISDFLSVLQELPESHEDAVESFDVADSANDADVDDVVDSADVVAPPDAIAAMIDATTDTPDNDSDADD